MDNFFELFQLPLAIPLDTAELTEKYQQLQKQYHPDNFATSSETRKMSNMQMSANINQGYQTLKNPISAAEYFLSLHGFDVNKEHQTIQDPDFLIEQFNLRERLDEIENQADIELLDDFDSEITQLKKNIYHDLLDKIHQQDWPSAITQIYKSRYLSRLIDHIEKLQDKQDVL